MGDFYEYISIPSKYTYLHLKIYRGKIHFQFPTEKGVCDKSSILLNIVMLVLGTSCFKEGKVSKTQVQRTAEQGFWQIAANQICIYSKY